LNKNEAHSNKFNYSTSVGRYR